MFCQSVINHLKIFKMTVTQISASKWVDSLITDRGIKNAIQLMNYNVSGKNPYFRESNEWVTAAWNRINEINPS